MADNRKVLIAELTARAGCDKEVSSVLSEYAVHVRNEPGNETFECYQTEDAPLKFLVYEIYSDEAAFKAHLADPMNTKINEQLSGITEGGSSLIFLNPISSHHS